MTIVRKTRTLGTVQIPTMSYPKNLVKFFLLPLAPTLVCCKMAQLGIFLSFYLHGYAKSHNLSSLDPFIFPALLTEKRKTIWSELESNPVPHASQATDLTTRPCLLGQY